MNASWPEFEFDCFDLKNKDNGAEQNSRKFNIGIYNFHR